MKFIIDRRKLSFLSSLLALSHLLLRASRASTFYDIPQIVSLLAGYPLNRGSGVVMFQKHQQLTNLF